MKSSKRVKKEEKEGEHSERCDHHYWTIVMCLDHHHKGTRTELYEFDDYKALKGMQTILLMRGLELPTDVTEEELASQLKELYTNPQEAKIKELVAVPVEVREYNDGRYHILVVEGRTETRDAEQLGMLHEVDGPNTSNPFRTPEPRGNPRMN